jgi:hypothetical protein
LKLYVTKDKLRDLLKIVNTLIPPPPVVEESEVSAVGELLPVSGDLMGEGGITEITPIQQSLKKVAALDAKFTMGQCSLVVRHNESKDNVAGESLLRTSFHGLVAQFKLSNHDMLLDMELSWYS